MNFRAIACRPLQIDGFDLLAFPCLERMSHFMHERSHISFIARRITKNCDAAFIRHGGAKSSRLFSFSVFEIDKPFIAHATKMFAEARRNLIEKMLGAIELFLDRRNAGRQGEFRMESCIPRLERRSSQCDSLFAV